MRSIDDRVGRKIARVSSCPKPPSPSSFATANCGEGERTVRASFWRSSPGEGGKVEGGSRSWRHGPQGALDVDVPLSPDEFSYANDNQLKAALNAVHSMYAQVTRCR